MSELSAVGKIKRAMRLAKLAEVGMTLSYFDVIELSGEIESLEETVRILDTRDDDALVTAYRKDNAELKRKLEVAEGYMAHNTVLLARALKAEALIKSLIAVGNIILNQDGKLDEDIKLAEAVWRVLVGQANE